MYFISYRLFQKISFLVIFLLLVFPIAQTLLFMKPSSYGTRKPSKLSYNLSSSSAYSDHDPIHSLLEKKNKLEEPLAKWSFGFVKDAFSSDATVKVKGFVKALNGYAISGAEISLGASGSRRINSCDSSILYVSRRI